MMAAPPIAERHKPHFHRKAPVLEPVRVATTANITISTALNNGDTLDGITLATDDRVLVKDQGTASQNGVYTVSASPARDYDLSSDDPNFGFLIYVKQGTANAGKVFANTNTSAPTIGSTSLTFSEFSGGAPTEILDIPTAETDTSLVLAPDGGGGVEFRAETGGGGGSAPITFDTPPASPHASNEEMDSALSGSWTWQAQSGTPTDQDTSWVDTNPTNPSYNVNSEIPGVLMFQPKAGEILKVYRGFAPTASTAWMIAAKMSTGRAWNTDDNIALVITKETSHNSSKYYPNTDGLLIGTYKAGGLNVSSFSVNGGGASARVNSDSGARDTFYFAFTGSTDNKIRAWFSTTGVAWSMINEWTALNINGNVNSVFMAASDGNNSGTPVLAAVEWIRFKEGDNRLENLGWGN